MPDDGDVHVPGRRRAGWWRKIDTPAGAIVIGGKGTNTYQLDHMPDVAAVIDLGGDNSIYEGTVLAGSARAGRHRPGGGNVYRATKPGVQGGAILGVSMLVNLEGGNIYEAQDVAQGSCLAGVGILIDYGGNNAIAASAACRDRPWAASASSSAAAASNDYHAAMWAQGFGGPLGFGLLDDLGGDDHYYCGGMYPNSYKPETPGYEGWGQGVGAGIRQVGQRRHRRDPQRRRPQRLRVRLPLARRRLLVRPGLRPRFRRQQPAPHLPARTSTAASGPSRSSSDSAADGAAITPWASASTTAATTSTKAPSWAAAWPGIARSACCATSAAKTTTRPPAA